jgi:hypothetical protein
MTVILTNLKDAIVASSDMTRGNDSQMLNILLAVVIKNKLALISSAFNLIFFSEIWRRKGHFWVG